MAEEALLRWAMICSVEEKTDMDELRLFGIWLTGLLHEQAQQLGLSQFWESQPDRVLHATPGSLIEAEQAYETIHTEHPGVIVLFHILPANNSPEYAWMKTLALKFSLIRQGVLLENAKSRFAGLELDSVLGNISQWVSRRLSQLTGSKNPMERGFDLRVGDGDIPLPSGHIHLNQVETLVQTVIHSHQSDDPSLSKMAVHVSGYPIKWNQWQLAGVFSDFLVTHIVLQARDAIIFFANKFHALQAALSVDARQIDDEHVLTVRPLHPQLVEQSTMNMC